MQKTIQYKEDILLMIVKNSLHLKRAKKSLETGGQKYRAKNYAVEENYWRFGLKNNKIAGFC